MTEKKPKVSVIILTYYHEQYIEAAIQSVLAQTVAFDYEVLISDDSSKDNTLKIVERLKKESECNISVHTYDNNVGTTRNLYDALLRAKGEYITLLSGDDAYCDSNKLVKQVRFLDSNPDYYAVGVTAECIYTDGKPVGYISPEEKYRDKEFLQKTFASGVNFPLHGIMFRNNMSDEMVQDNYYNMVIFSKYIEDLTLCMMLFEYGRVYILNDIAYKITKRRPDDKNQHNYNSIIKTCDSMLMHVELTCRLQEKYGDSVNLKPRLAEYEWILIKESVKSSQYKYIKDLKNIPCFYLLIEIFRYIINKITSHLNRR